MYFKEVNDSSRVESRHRDTPLVTLHHGSDNSLQPLCCVIVNRVFILTFSPEKQTFSFPRVLWQRSECPSVYFLLCSPSLLGVLRHTLLLQGKTCCPPSESNVGVIPPLNRRWALEDWEVSELLTGLEELRTAETKSLSKVLMATQRVQVRLQKGSGGYYLQVQLFKSLISESVRA